MNLVEAFKSFLSKHNLNNSTERRLLRHLQHKPYLRLELLRSVLGGQSRLPEDVTQDEMVTLLALACVAKTPDQAVHIMERYTHEWWAFKFDSCFFETLTNTAEELERSAMDGIASRLLQLGLIAAKMHRNPLWAEQFEDRIRQRHHASIRDLPFLRQRGW